jgi:hypothetical protein
MNIIYKKKGTNNGSRIEELNVNDCCDKAKEDKK